MSAFIPKPDCTRLDGACFRDGECLADCDRVAESLVRGSEVRQLREALATERAALEAETKMLADCFRMAGADCDGNEDWRIAPRALQAVTDLRRDYGEACDEISRLEAQAKASYAASLIQRAEAAEAQLSALRSRVEGLAAKWDDSYRVVRQNCADELRELLGAGGAENG